MGLRHRNGALVSVAGVCPRVAGSGVVCGARFYRGAWNQLRIGSSNMDTLVALGSTTAFAYSVWGLFSGWHQHLFFMESASIITLISAGHWIESLVSAKSESSLRKLLQLAPQRARLLDGMGAEKEVPVSQLRVGDNVRIKPGDRIPTDGEVMDGVSTVDESMLTGESMPVEKGAGGALFAGTVNINGMLQARVTATARQRLWPTSSKWFVARKAAGPTSKTWRSRQRCFRSIVVVIALGTGFWWGLHRNPPGCGPMVRGFLWPAHHPAGALASAIYHAAAVLIIACPCAMGLATPVAIMAGANAASERGILIRDGLALEKTGRLNAILFDKTGTLTHGRMTVAAHEDHAGTSSMDGAAEKLRRRRQRLTASPERGRGSVVGDPFAGRGLGGSAGLRGPGKIQRFGVRCRVSAWLAPLVERDRR